MTRTKFSAAWLTLLSAVLLIAIATSLPALAADADENIYPGPEIYFNGERVEFADQQPIIYHDRTLVPVRGVLETIGARVEWYSSIRYVEIAYDDYFINLYIGNPMITLSIPDAESATGYITKEYLTDVAPQIIGDRTMVPLRILSELMGLKVDWIDGKVYIEEQEQEQPADNTEADAITAPENGDASSDPPPVEPPAEATEDPEPDVIVIGR
ncbi:MAG: copper amine oxidase N-terminal domain-containing protein [Syntrophomonadaceae bacterium]|nr:copper amine oxidase N-terminal domain-containing protein [Syntrophomonadaceae bacterium]